MWSDYHVPDGTFRESLHNRSGESHLGKGHLGYKYKWNEETVGSNGDEEEVKKVNNDGKA